MTRVLVSDTSILIDLERGELLTAAFRLSYQFVVPDELYERELASHGGPELLRLGLRVEELDPAQLTLAQEYFNNHGWMSSPDAFALVLAKTAGHILLTGDSHLRALAEAEAVEVHGLLWLLDCMADQMAADLNLLHRGLSQIAAHPQTRLPQAEVNQCLARFRR